MGNTKVLDAKVISKAQSGVRTITAIVTSGRADRDGDIVDVKSLRFPLLSGGYVLGKDLNGSQKLDLPFLLNHSFSVEDMIGGWQSGRYIEATGEIELEAGVSTREKAQDLMKLFDEGFVGNNFSITMADYTYDAPYIYDAEVVEVSFVFKGSNREAKLQMVKSLLKGENMEKSTALEDKKAELKKLQDEVAELEKATTETQEETTDENSETETATNVEVKEETTDETQEVTEDQIKEKETDTMEKSVVNQVKDPVQVTEEVAVKNYSQRAIKENFVDQFVAKFVEKDTTKLTEVRTKALEMAGVKSKEVFGQGTTADTLYLPNLVVNDIIKCYQEVAGYSQGVSRMDITGQTLIDLPVMTGSGRFQRVGRGQRKPISNPEMDSVRFEPKEWATIVAWYDYVQKNSKMAVYQLMVEFIAEAYALTEDDIVINYAGGAVVGESVNDPASGLVPLLTAAGRVHTAAGTTGADYINALATALGTVKGSGVIEVGANRATWLRVTTATNGMGNFIANADGTVALGGGGTLRPVFSDSFDDGDMVVGIRKNYQYVTNGGLATLFSQHAYLEDAVESGTDLNLFQQDASGLRAEFWAVGGPRCLTSFALVQLPAIS